MSAAMVFVALVVVGGCAPGKGPFLQVQLCVHDRSGVQKFVDEMHNLAAEKSMSLVDRSSEARRDLEAMGQISPRDPKRILRLRVAGEKGIGVSAANFGLATYQITLSFSEGSDPLKARQFASEVIQRLRQHWNVSIVPPNRGALPMKGCG